MQQYISPIRFFEYCQINLEALPTMEVSKLKKIVQLEFSSSENGIIQIDNWDYSPQYFVELFEKEDFSKIINLHIQIWKKSSLLAFLERQQWENKEILILPEDSEDFIVFISPYFTYSFSKILGKYIKDRDFTSAIALLKYKEIIAIDDFDNAYQSVRLFINASIHFFKNISKENYKKYLDKITPWANTDWPIFLNQLPANFASYIDELTRKIINLTVEIQKADRNLTYRISIKLTQLNLEAGLKKLVNSNHKIYLSKTRFIELKIRGKRRIVNKYKAFFIFMLLLFLSMVLAIKIEMWYNQFKKLHADEVTIDSFEYYEKKYRNLLASNNAKNPVYSIAIDSILFNSFDPVYYNFNDLHNKHTILKFVNKSPYSFKLFGNNNNGFTTVYPNQTQIQSIEKVNNQLIIVANNYKDIVKKYGNNHSDNFPKIYGLKPAYIFKDDGINNTTDTISFTLEYATGMIKTTINKPKTINLNYLY